MKKSFILYLIVIALTTTIQSKAQKSASVERIYVDLNNDNRIDSITLNNPPMENDPGQFSQICIHLTGASPFNFKAKGVWDYIDKEFSQKNRNDIKSNRVFIRKNNSKTFILLFGYPFGSGRDEFSIIMVKDNQAKVVFNKQVDNPILFSDLDKNGIPELLGRNNEEIYTPLNKQNADIGTYSPYLIYSLKDEFQINLPLTQKYNETHYVWAGLKYNENIKVLYPRKQGKPRLLTK